MDGVLCARYPNWAALPDQWCIRSRQIQSTTHLRDGPEDISDSRAAQSAIICEMTTLTDARRKFEWAERHIVDLQFEIEQFCIKGPKPYTLGSKAHGLAAIRHTTIFVESLKKIPDSISLRLGDAVHNLRSSLDYIAYAMVRANGKEPTRDTCFPIADPAKKYTPSFAERATHGMSVAAQREIDSVQPYNTGNPTLWNLHRLDIEDKHRLLVTAQFVSEAWEVDAFGSDRTLQFDKTGVLMQGHEVVNIPNSTFERQKLEDFKLVLDIAFGETEIVHGQQVTLTLHNTANLVREIINRFEVL
jgi:hypothetical protein